MHCIVELMRLFYHLMNFIFGGWFCNSICWIFWHLRSVITLHIFTYFYHWVHVPGLDLNSVMWDIVRPIWMNMYGVMKQIFLQERIIKGIYDHLMYHALERKKCNCIIFNSLTLKEWHNFFFFLNNSYSYFLMGHGYPN